MEAQNWDDWDFLENLKPKKAKKPGIKTDPDPAYDYINLTRAIKAIEYNEPEDALLFIKCIHSEDVVREYRSLLKRHKYQELIWALEGELEVCKDMLGIKE